MKIILLSIAMLTLTLNASAQEPVKKKEMREVQVTETVKTQNPNEAKTPPAQEKAPITFSKETIERNEIPYDSQELFVFEFKNTGDTPVLIQNVQTSCGCTTASKPVEPIQPGQKSQISVHYDTKRVGAFTKSITVTTNVSTTPIILTIKGIVLAAPAVEQIEAPKN